jgi:hypothetical protein
MSIMTLAFPNPSRSFDEGRNAVLFFGHDGLFEIRFFVEAGALAMSGTALPMSGMSEAKCLSVFDAARTPILEIAREGHSHGRRNYYTLTATDFRGGGRLYVSFQPPASRNIGHPPDGGGSKRHNPNSDGAAIDQASGNEKWG